MNHNYRMPDVEICIKLDTAIFGDQYHYSNHCTLNYNIELEHRSWGIKGMSCSFNSFHTYILVDESESGIDELEIEATELQIKVTLIKCSDNCKYQRGKVWLFPCEITYDNSSVADDFAISPTDLELSFNAKDLKFNGTFY